MENFLRFVLFVLDVIRVIFVLGMLVVFLCIIALIVLWTLKEAQEYFRRLAYERRQRQTRKKIEKLFQDFPNRQLRTIYIPPTDDPLLTLHTIEQDQETIDKATEYHNGISE